MASKMFVNLPVKDLKKSVDFFTHLGYKFNPQFTNENATCMIISEENYAMLLVESFFSTFTPKPISDAKKSTESLIALSFDSKEEVIEIVKKAVEAGAKTLTEPKDMGFMYQHGYEDLDGHMWEVFYMDPKAIQG